VAPWASAAPPRNDAFHVNFCSEQRPPYGSTASFIVWLKLARR
jgi:hypothetical protein